MDVAVERSPTKSSSGCTGLRLLYGLLVISVLASWLVKIVFCFMILSHNGPKIFNPNHEFIKDLMVDDFEENEVNTVLRLYEKPFDRLIDERRNLLNPYSDGFSFDLYAYVSENEAGFGSDSLLIWLEKNLTYGPDSSSRELQTGIAISNNVQNNGSLYLHLYLVKSGIPPSSFAGMQLNEDYCCFICSLETKTIHRVRRLNLYKRKRTDGNHFSDELHSHWYPNLTINLVHNQDLEELPLEVDLVDTFPIFFNDQFNLLGNFQSINQTTKFLPLHLTFDILNLLEYSVYTRSSDKLSGLRTIKYAFFGWFNKRLIRTEEDQDFIRKKIVMELAMSLLVLCKNYDKPGESLKKWSDMRGVSMRSIWFELAQSLAVLEIPALPSAKLSWALQKRMKKKNLRDEYHRETNSHDAVATRLFAVFIFLPSLTGYLFYAYHYDQYESFPYHIPMALYDFFWYFGSIIWMPQLYINYRHGQTHDLISFTMMLKILQFILVQFICFLYFLRTGLFSLLIKYHPSAIVGLLVNSLLCVALICQFCTNLSRNEDFRNRLIEIPLRSMDERFNESILERERMRKRMNERGSELVEVTGDKRRSDLADANPGQVSAEISESKA